MWKEPVPEQNSGVQFSVYVAHPDEILVAKFRLTSAPGRQSQRAGLAARGRTAARGPAAGGLPAFGGTRLAKNLLSPGPGGREEPAAAHAAEGAGCRVSLATETDESETAPRVVLCTSLFWGLLKRVGRGMDG